LERGQHVQAIATRTGVALTAEGGGADLARCLYAWAICRRLLNELEPREWLRGGSIASVFCRELGR
jgi:hypothetical protein